VVHVVLIIEVEQGSTILYSGFLCYQLMLRSTILCHGSRWQIV